MSDMTGTTSSPGTDEGVSNAVALEDDATDVVEAAGHFRIYLGAAAGVGKTFAMLNEGHRRAKRGTDVVIGFVECHGRPLTEELCDGLEIVPRRSSSTGGPPSRRWTSTRCWPATPKSPRRRARPHQRPRIPQRQAMGGRHRDPRCRHRRDHHGQHPAPREHRRRGRADDRGPGPRAGPGLGRAQGRPDRAGRLVTRTLRRRMLHGNIYPAAKVPQALTHFFRTDNLIALRELALRFLADETEEESARAPPPPPHQVVWETSERILVAVTTAPGTEAIVRRASRMAARIKADLHVLHVVAGERPTPHMTSSWPSCASWPTDVGADWTEVQPTTPRRRSSTSPAPTRSPRSWSARAAAAAGRSSKAEAPSSGRSPAWPPPPGSTCTSSPGVTPSRSRSRSSLAKETRDADLMGAAPPDALGLGSSPSSKGGPDAERVRVGP